MNPMRLVFTVRLILLCIIVSIASFPLPAFADTEGPTKKVFRFESDVLPIFEANCLSCHGEVSQQSGLDLRIRESILKGGESGPAIKPGFAEESLLFKKVFSGSMPIGDKKLSAQEVELIRHWLNAGALKEGEEIGSVASNLEKVQASERDVMVAIFQVRCVVCHGRRKREGDLDLRTRASLFKGGKSGPAIIPGKPEESLLIKRIVAEEMPPLALQRPYAVRPVTLDELDELRQWIAAGAPTGEEGVLKVGSGPDPLVAEKDREFWSFQPPKRAQAPTVRGKDLVRTPIDAFLLEKLEAKGLSFSPEAAPLTLMRRAYFDLTGLPPDPEEIEVHLKDKNPNAYERMIDRLLASPHYGERWARYWLDAAGYADSEGGSTLDYIRTNGYRYRDYVIRSLNNDKPYDQFLVEQIAGDELFDYKAAGELSSDQLSKLVATGFLRTAPDGTFDISENFIPSRMDVLADQLNIFSSMVMGLTVACAQCHSHKYDPIPQRDYYRFSAIFRTAYDPYDWYAPIVTTSASSPGIEAYPERSLPHTPKAEREAVEAHNAPIQEEIKELERSLEEKAKPYHQKLLKERLSELPEGVGADIQEALEIPAEKRSSIQKYLVKQFGGTLEIAKVALEKKFEDYKEEAGKIKKAIGIAKKKLKRKPEIRALFDLGENPTPTHVLLRGDYQNLGGRVEPGIPSVLRAGLNPYKVVKPGWTTETTGRRLALARWLTQSNHPLTSRVMVNRVWQNHFGRGIVETVGNFGRMGAKPSHPKLLDWLATEFVRQGWSLKRLHKLIMTSGVYRQSSDWSSSHAEIDPENKLLGKFPMLRLDADAIRDTILKVAGRLNKTQYGPAVEVEVQEDGEVVEKCGDQDCRRSIYILQRRSTPLTMLQAFDAPQLSPNCLKRGESTVSSQALQLWNGEMLRDNAQYFAGRVMDTVGEERVEKQVERVYLAALSRYPTQEERVAGIERVTGLTGKWGGHFDEKVPQGPKQARARWEALATFCHVILNSAEMIFVD